ncbi:aminopeptidase [soil metagenome]
MPTGPITSEHERKRLERYARLIVGAGVNIQEGQYLLVHGELAHAPLIRAITEDAYAHGASYVDVLYSDPWVHRAFVAGAPDETIDSTPPWQLLRLNDAIDAKGAVIRIAGAAHAEIFDGLDAKRLTDSRMPDLRQRWLGAVTDSELSWTIVAYPDEEWATEALGEPDVERLWQALEVALRLDQDDPAAAWQARADELIVRSAIRNERAFDALRYRGPGTELEVGLIPGAKFLGGREHTKYGQQHLANIPTEEVFTSPDRNRAEGTVRSTKPLALSGGLVEGLEVTFSGGEITEVKADRGADLVRAEVASDENAKYLGEVALVDRSSRVEASNLVFFNTLFDENAVSHIAYGGGFAWAIDHMDEDAPERKLLNDSRVHTDFMVGGTEVKIDGVDADGTVVPLLHGGEWQI